MSASTCTLLFSHRADGRTVLEQHDVSPPFAVLGSFHLDPGAPGLCTVVLQSTGGPLRPGDELDLRVVAGPGAQCLVTLQAAPLVHAGEHAARSSISVVAAARAWCEVISPTTLLAPGALLRNEITVDPDADSVVLVTDAYAPASLRDNRYRLDSSTTVRRDGRLLAADRLVLDTCDDTASSAGVLGPNRAHGALWILGRDLVLDDVDVAQGALPNAAGRVVRTVGADGAVVSAALASAWRAVRAAGLGVEVSSRLGSVGRTSCEVRSTAPASPHGSLELGRAG